MLPELKRYVSQEEEFNRAEALQNDKRAGTVGFALTILQRRLLYEDRIAPIWSG